MTLKEDFCSRLLRGEIVLEGAIVDALRASVAETKRVDAERAELAKRDAVLRAEGNAAAVRGLLCLDLLWDQHEGGT